MTACVGWHELIVRLADPEDDLSSADITYRLAVGTDDTTTPAYSNTSLNNEVSRTDISDFINNGTDLFTSTFLDNAEANDHVIVEAGVVAVVPSENAEYLCAHELINAINKTSGKTATIEQTLANNNDPNDA
jgi:hypothetical protein